MAQKWEFWIDRGGTFTDVVARRPDGTPRRRTSCSRRTRSATGTPPSRASGACSGSAPASRSRPSGSRAVKMGTTVATNALLERTGEPTVLVITRGLPRRAADRLPEPAAHLRPADRAARAALLAGDRGRRAARRADGEVVVPLDEDAVAADLRARLRRRLPRRSPSCACTATATRRMRRAIGEIARAGRLHPGLACRTRSAR